MIAELLVFIMVGCAIFVVASPVIFFIVSFLKKGLNGAFENYMDYKTTQAILNNADESNWKRGP
jgi:hypothetical protein